MNLQINEGLIRMSEAGEGQENHCPTCGAEPNQPCSVFNPATEMGIELGNAIHKERLNYKGTGVDGEVEIWSSMKSAPKDGTEIIGWCVHDADPVTINAGHSLTTYAGFAEGFSHAEDGAHVLVWGGSFDDSSYEEPNGAKMPDWWFVKGSEFERVANPILWRPLLPPTPDEISAAMAQFQIDNGTTACWCCSKIYLRSASDCPFCTAANANVNLELAESQRLEMLSGGGLQEKGNV